jgi:hypothetical protein
MAWEGAELEVELRDGRSRQEIKACKEFQGSKTISSRQFRSLFRSRTGDVSRLLPYNSHHVPWAAQATHGGNLLVEGHGHAFIVGNESIGPLRSISTV